MSDITYGFGVEIKLENDSDFLRVKETLTRIGKIGQDNSGAKALYQAAHILHKRGRYFIIHFKELYALDKAAYERLKTIKPETDLVYLQNVFDDVHSIDILERDCIVQMLERWKLLTIADSSAIKNQNVSVKKTQLEIIPFKEKHNWKLLPRYKMGRARLAKTETAKAA